MEEITDDMRAILKAAYKAGPTGETFYLESLKLRCVSDQARHDCAFILARDPFRYLERRTVFTKDAAGGAIQTVDFNGLPYALSKLGRPVARQITSDDLREARGRAWKVAHRLTTAILAISVPLAVAWLNRKIEHLGSSGRQAETQTTTQAR